MLSGTIVPSQSYSSPSAALAQGAPRFTRWPGSVMFRSSVNSGIELMPAAAAESRTLDGQVQDHVLALVDRLLDVAEPELADHAVLTGRLVEPIDHLVELVQSGVLLTAHAFEARFFQRGFLWGPACGLRSMVVVISTSAHAACGWIEGRYLSASRYACAHARRSAPGEVNQVVLSRGRPRRTLNRSAAY